MWHKSTNSPWSLFVISAIVFLLFSFILSLRPPLSFLLCLPPASCLVIAHHSSLCTEARLCVIMTEWEGRRRKEREKERVSSGEKESKKGGELTQNHLMSVCLCWEKKTSAFVFLHGSAPLNSRGLAGQERGSAVPNGWRAYQRMSDYVCVCVCTLRACVKVSGSSFLHD